MCSHATITAASLAGLAMFASLGPRERKELAARATGREFAAGEVMLEYADDPSEAYVILSGTAEVAVCSRAGRCVSFCTKGPGDFLGEFAAIDGRARCATVTAVTNCRVMAFKGEEFLRVLDRFPALSRELLRRLTGQIRDLSERLFDTSALLVRQRVHVELLRLARAGHRNGSESVITPVPRHAAIASRIGTHREAVAREISRLTRLGLLSKRSDGLAVLDLTRLERCVVHSRGKLPTTL